LAHLRVYFYDRLEPQAPAAVEGRSTGDLLARVTKDVDRVEVFFAHTLAPATTAVLVPAATVVVVAVAVSPAGALVLAVGLLAAGVGVPLLGRTGSARAATALRQGRGAVAQHVTDSVQGVREVLAFGYDTRRLAEQTALEAPVDDGLTSLGRWTALRRGANTFIVLATLSAELAVLSGHALATVTLGLALALAAFPSVLAVEDFAGDLQQAYASARRIFEITEPPASGPDTDHARPQVAPPSGGPVPDHPSPEAAPPTGGPTTDHPRPEATPPTSGHATDHRSPEVAPRTGRLATEPARHGTTPPAGFRPTATLRAPSVTFTHVTFTHPDAAGRPSRLTPALDDVSFEARAGRVTAIVGPSGSGKSTLAALLVRVWDPDQGTIRLGDTDIRDFDVDQLRAEVGTTSQRPYLFNDTVEGNLRLAKPDATPDDIAAANRAAALDSVLAEEPDGLATPVGELGGRLSGGQAQRLALARTLLADPGVLVLDEATSQVDPVTEQQILSGVKAAAQGKTVLYIAHRLRTVETADWIVVLDEGRVVQQGDHQTLSTTPGPFATLLAREL
ncbi:MAG: ABC transporter ATP-binding protein/permease, partial [Propionibacteriaceae bacterium]|nr:ABC transporter ATP-binding protein/permease [Propionibacteriaceae bacterium]